MSDYSFYSDRDGTFIANFTNGGKGAPILTDEFEDAWVSSSLSEVFDVVNLGWLPEGYRIVKVSTVHRVSTPEVGELSGDDLIFKYLILNQHSSWYITTEQRESILRALTSDDYLIVFTAKSHQIAARKLLKQCDIEFTARGEIAISVTSLDHHAILVLGEGPTKAGTIHACKDLRDLRDKLVADAEETLLKMTYPIVHLEGTE